MSVAYCQTCGFGAEGALACVICGCSLNGEKPPSQIGWVDDPTHTPVPTSATQLVINAPGRIFGKRYKILGSLGRGAMGVVLRAEDLEARRQVALKLMIGDASDPRLVSRFKREVQIASEIKHPNALQVFDAGVQDGACFYAMELVDGGALADRLDGRTGLPLQQVMQVAEQLASVVGAAHAAGVIHRDLKPSNVLLTPEGKVKLVDFGIAKIRQGAEQTDLTRTGMMAGTAHYMAPEQIKDAKNVDARADLYALGALLYELLVGHPPFLGDSTMGIAVKHLNEAAPPLANERPDVPPALERLVLRCLEKDPAARFQSAEELLEALRAIEETTTRERMLNGDMLVLNKPGARFAVEIHTRDKHGHGFELGQRIQLDGRNYRLVERIEGRPPYTHTLRFAVQTDVEAIGRPVDYRGLASIEESSSFFERLGRKLRGK